MNKPKKIAIYSRKSKFTGKGESIENQVLLCRQYVKINFDNINEQDILIYEDEGFSGGHFDRPQFKNMMQIVHAGEISHIICYRLDRISRSISDFAKLIEELNKKCTAFISIKEQFDTSNPMGRAMMYISSVFSQLERETIAERIKDNMQELAKTGRWLGGITPTGYCSEPVEIISKSGKECKAFKLSIVSDEAELVELIFNKFLRTRSLTKTAEYLNHNNFKTKRKNSFTRFSVSDILKNPVYMIADDACYEYFYDHGVQIYSDKTDFDSAHGIMAYSKTLQKHGKAHIHKNLCDWIVAVGNHYGIISGADWIRAQKIINENRSSNNFKSKSYAGILSGILFCQNCSCLMNAKFRSQKTNGGKINISYICKNKSHEKTCKIKNLDGGYADKYIHNIIKMLPENFNYFCELILNEKDRLKNCPNAIEPTANSAVSFKPFSDFYHLFEISKAEQKQSVIKTIFDKIIWDGDILHIYYAGGQK